MPTPLLQETSWYASQIESGFIPRDKRKASTFLAGQAISYPTFAMQFVNAFRCIVEIDGKGHTTKCVTSFYSKDVDDDIFIELDKLIRTKHPGRVNPDYNVHDLARYLSQLSNLLAKYYAISSGYRIGWMFSPKLYELPDSARDFWSRDWEYNPNDLYSLHVDDATTELMNIGTRLSSWYFPTQLHDQIVKLFSVKKLGGEASAPYVGYTPTIQPACYVRSGKLNQNLTVEDPRFNSVNPNYVWFKGDTERDQGDAYFTPPTTRALKQELDAFRSNEQNKVIHAAIGKSLGMSEIKIAQPSDAMTGDFLVLWQNGGQIHDDGFMVPNAGAADFDGRYQIPIFGSGSITDEFVTWFTHAYGPDWDQVAGRPLSNYWGVIPETGMIGAGSSRLPLVVYYHPDVRKPAVRYETGGKVTDRAYSILEVVPFDRFRFGWKHIIHLDDSILRGISEVGAMPANRMEGKLYWVDASQIRKQAWHNWRSLLGVG